MGDALDQYNHQISQAFTEMNLGRRQQGRTEDIQSSWNCYSPFMGHNQLFLAQKITQSDSKVNQTSRQYPKANSDIITSNRSKMSLRNNKQQKILNQSGEVKSSHGSNIKKYNSSNFSQDFAPIPFNTTLDSLFYYPQTPQSARINYQPTETKITVLSPQISFSSLSSPPVITFSHSFKRDGAKGDDFIKKQEKNEERNRDKLQTETTVEASQSEQLKHSYENREKFLRSKPDFKTAALRSLEIKREKDTLQNPEPDSPLRSKQETTKSLMTSHQLSFHSKDKLLGESVRSFCSEKNVSKRIQKMSQVQEIKSQPDSEQNNDSDSESIVLGRLDMSTYSGLNKNGGLMVHVPTHPTNSSIEFRDSL